MVCAYRLYLGEEQERRERRAGEYRRAVDALLDMLGEKWADVHGIDPTKGEDKLMRLVKAATWPTEKVWDHLNPIDPTNLRGFLTRTIRRARGEERALLTRYRQTLAENYEDWSHVLEKRSRQPEGFLSWLDRMRTTDEDLFHLWAYMEWAQTEARESLHGKDPDFAPVQVLMNRWARW